MATLKSQATQTNTRTTTHSTGGVNPFAAKFNAAAKEDPFPKLPIGKFEAIVCKGGTNEKDGKKVDWLEYEITEEGDEQGKKGKSFHTRFDSQGEIHTGGRILARYLLLLGYTDAEGIVSEKHLEKVLSDIEKNPVRVIINVKCKSGYTNIELDSVFQEQDNKEAGTAGDNDIPY